MSGLGHGLYLAAMQVQIPEHLCNSVLLFEASSVSAPDREIVWELQKMCRPGGTKGCSMMSWL
jgi:hypothetical protein